jgi:2'-5' RNA ligase
MADETALIVAVPEAEAAVGPHRARLDAAATWGVPAHVTVVYPFGPVGRLDAFAPAIAEAVASVPTFDFTLTRTTWFGSTVLWLAPEPATPFRDLTHAVGRQFPEFPPYGGEFDDVVPHVTVGHDRPVEELRAAASALRPWLPIRSRCRSVQLIAGSSVPGSWRTVAEFPLG